MDGAQTFSCRLGRLLVGLRKPRMPSVGRRSGAIRRANPTDLTTRNLESVWVPVAGVWDCDTFECLAACAVGCVVCAAFEVARAGARYRTPYRGEPGRVNSFLVEQDRIVRISAMAVAVGMSGCAHGHWHCAPTVVLGFLS